MKKSVCFLLFFVMISICLSGCDSKKAFPADTTCESIMKAAQSVGTPPEAEKIYLKSEENLDTYSMSLWADGIFEESKELGLLSDYAMYLGAGTKTYEVTVLKTESSDDLASLTDLIERRKVTLELGDKGMYDPDFEVRMENSVVYNDGLFVVFLITDDNDAALKAIEALKE